MTLASVSRNYHQHVDETTHRYDVIYYLIYSLNITALQFTSFVSNIEISLSLMNDVTKNYVLRRGPNDV